MAADGAGEPLVGYARYLNDLLRRLKVENGGPSLRVIAARIPGSASPGYLSEVFAGKKIPSPEMAGWIAAALGAGDAEQRAAHDYAEAADDDRPGPAGAVPWRVDTFALTAPPVPEGAAPSALLNARYQVVGFTGRDDELRVSAAWRDEAGPALRVRLLHGQGGQGKTRLAAEFAARSARAGWAVGRVRHRSDAARPAKPLPAARLGSAAGLLLVLDHAERWPVQDLIDFLISYQAGIRGDRRLVPVRVLLLARPFGGWWQGVRAALHEYDFTAVTADQLAPLVPTPADRQQLFATARDRFAALLHLTDVEHVVPPPKLATDAEFGRALTVQMAALAAVDAAIADTTPPAEAADLSTYLLDRERRHWQRLHAKIRTADGGGTDETAITTSPTVMAHAVYTAILTRPLPQRVGAVVLVRAGVASQTDAGRVLTDHAVCYPPTDQSTVLEPLYPDRLAEDFLALTSPGNPNGAADPWVAAALTTLLFSDPDAGPPPYARQAITVLIEAAQRWPHLAHHHLFPLLRIHPRLALAAGGAALITLASTPDIDLAVLEAVEPLLPTERHIDLDIAAAAITTILTTHRLAHTADPAEQARLHATHAFRLANAGRPEQAFAADEEATGIYRRLAEANPGAYLPDLARSLNSLGRSLSELGRREQALACAEEAVTIRRRLAEANPDAYLPDLAGSLNNLGVFLSELGRHEQALTPTEEATSVYRQLAEANPDAYLPNLATSLNNLGSRLSSLGRREQALTLTEEAVTIQRRLAEANPDAYLTDLAGSLNNLGVFLSELGRHEQALTPTEEATSVYRQLAEANPDAYLPNLAGSLNNLGVRLSSLGRRDQALAPAEEATSVYRRLAEANPDAYLPNLATSLNSLGMSLSGRGRHEQALARAEEAVTIRRRLAEANPDAYLPDLAGSLNNLGVFLSELGRREQALAPTEEATTVYRRLAEASPDAYLSDLAMSLDNLGVRLSELGRREQALAPTEEATSVYRRLAEASPDAYLPDLAGSLNNLGIRLSELGRREQALACAEEAVTIRRRLAEANLDAYLPDLAGSLNNLGIRLSELGRRDQALALAEEAASIYRRLADANPDAYLPDLAMSLNNLGVLLSRLARLEEALACAEEAVTIRRRLAEANPDAYLPNLASSLGVYGLVCVSLKANYAEALESVTEAISLFEPLAEQLPEVFAGQLFSAYRILADVLNGLGRAEEASELRQQIDEATSSERGTNDR